MTTEGAITLHARYRLAQLETLAREAAEDVTRLQKVYDEQSEGLAQYSAGPSVGSVQVALENLQTAQAKAHGSNLILDRFAAKMKSPEFLQQLADADAAKEKAESTNIATEFESSLGPRIEEAAKTLAALIPEIQALVGKNAQVASEMILAVERVGFRELTASVPITDQGTGLAMFSTRMLQGFKNSGVDHQLLRYLGMQR